MPRSEKGVRECGADTAQHAGQDPSAEVKTPMLGCFRCRSQHGSQRHPACGRYNPIKTIKTSFIGTMNMLGLAKRTKARFLLTSTSEVYGDPLVHPQVLQSRKNHLCPRLHHV